MYLIKNWTLLVLVLVLVLSLWVFYDWSSILILMVVRSLEIKMPLDRHFPRVDTLGLKLQIERKIGHGKADNYFNLLNKYLSLKLTKSEFDKLCIRTLGRENICLHNRLIRAILKNACSANSPPPKEGKTGRSFMDRIPNGYHISSLQSLCKDEFPRSPRKGRTPNLRDRRFRDRPSPLGPNGKTDDVVCEHSAPKVQELQSATELFSLGSKPPGELNSVEEGEEVEQVYESPNIYSRSPVKAPFGICMNGKETRKVHRNGFSTAFFDTCHDNGELPDASSLKTRLEHKLETEGLKISMDCVNILNNGLDIYLKRLIRPCLALSGSRSGNNMRYVQKPNRPISVSMLDFRVAMESNPTLLGEDWPEQLEKVCLFASEE